MFEPIHSNFWIHDNNVQPFSTMYSKIIASMNFRLNIEILVTNARILINQVRSQTKKQRLIYLIIYLFICPRLITKNGFSVNM